MAALNREFKLWFLKLLANVPARLLDRLLPECEPTYPQGKILERVYQRMFAAYRLEVAQGVFRELGSFEGDGNFLRLLNVSRKLLLAVSEDDRYYRAWLGLAVILAHEEYERFLVEVLPGEVKRLSERQWLTGPSMLSDAAVVAGKVDFVENLLCFDLRNLARDASYQINEGGKNKI